MSGTRRAKDSSKRGRTAKKSRVQFLPVLQSPCAPFVPIPFHSSLRGFFLPYLTLAVESSPLAPLVVPSASAPRLRHPVPLLRRCFFLPPASSSVPLDEKFLPRTSNSRAIKNKNPDLSHFDSRRDQRLTVIFCCFRTISDIAKIVNLIILLLLRILNYFFLNVKNSTCFIYVNNILFLLSMIWRHVYDVTLTKRLLPKLYVTNCTQDDPVSIKDSPGWLETVQVEQGRCCVPLASRNGPC